MPWQPTNNSPAAAASVVGRFNAATFPQDAPAKAGIDVKVELQPGTGDAEYLAQLAQALDAAALRMPRPHLVIYNAGTDVLAGDPLGRWVVCDSERARCLCVTTVSCGTHMLPVYTPHVRVRPPWHRLAVTPQGVLERDTAVWQFAQQRLRAPICVLLSGGYTRASAGVIVDSLASLLGGIAQQQHEEAQLS